MDEVHPDLVAVVGDVDASLAAALTAAKLGPRVGTWRPDFAASTARRRTSSIACSPITISTELFVTNTRWNTVVFGDPLYAPFRTRAKRPVNAELAGATNGPTLKMTS